MQKFYEKSVTNVEAWLGYLVKPYNLCKNRISQRLCEPAVDLLSKTKIPQTEINAKINSKINSNREMKNSLSYFQYEEHYCRDLTHIF